MNQPCGKKTPKGTAQYAPERLHASEKIWTKNFLFILISNFFIFLGFQMTIPTIPLYVEKMGGNEQLMGLVVGIFTFSALLIRPYAGFAVDTKGRKRLYLFGLAVFVLSVGSYGLIQSLLLLFIMRIVQGIGWGFSTTASGTIVTDLVPPRRRGEGMGYFGLSGNIAMAIGPSLGLILAGTLSFFHLFFTCAILGLMAILFAVNIRYQEQKTEDRKQNVQRAILEKSAIPPSLLIFFITFTFGGIAAFLPTYTLQKEISGIYLYFVLYAVSLLISRIFGGKIYDMKGHKAVYIPGAALVITAMLLLAWLPNSLILYTAAILYGFGFGAIQPALQAWSVQEVAPWRRGSANATFFSFFDLGIGIGSIVFGQIAYAFGYASIYYLSACSVAFSVILYLFLLKREREKKKRAQEEKHPGTNPVP